MRRPDSKRHTLRAAHFGNVRAELFIDLFVTPFAEEMQIDFTDHPVKNPRLSVVNLV